MADPNENILTSDEESDIIPTIDELRILKNLREKAALVQYGTIRMEVIVDFTIHTGEIKKGEIIEVKPRL